ncbi:hypothetical protein ES703_107666 [subsurface metagenome]
MIPLMSLMIGAYIFTRMFVLFGRDDLSGDKATKILIKIFSLATMAITLYCVYSIIMAGAEIPSSLY